MDVEPGGGGTIEVEQNASSSYPTTLSFETGTSVRLEAVPAPGYHFDNWGGDLSGTTNPTTIVIDCNKKITASFSPVTPVKTSWWLIGGILTGIIIIGVIISLAVRSRMA